MGGTDRFISLQYPKQNLLQPKTGTTGSTKATKVKNSYIARMLNKNIPDYEEIGKIIKTNKNAVVNALTLLNKDRLLVG